MRTPAAAHLIQSAVDQAVHQGTGGYFESLSTWKGEKKPHSVQNKNRVEELFLIKNPGGNTFNNTIQVDVGEGFDAQR